MQRPNLSHMGILVFDPARMEAFYAEVLDLIVSDRGVSRNSGAELVFMSGDPSKHHQLVLASGRPAEAAVSTVMQISFLVDSLEDLRRIRRKALERGATDFRQVDHGNAWSIYFKDPEGNVVEAYLDSPFYIPQPHGDPFDLEAPDAEILRTEAACRADPGFMTRAAWEAKMRGAMASRAAGE